MTPGNAAIVAELLKIEAQLAALTDRIDFLEIAVVTIAALTFGLLVAVLLERIR